MRLRLVMLLIGLLIAAEVSAEDVKTAASPASGNDLYRWMTSAAAGDQLFGTFYIMGVTDAESITTLSRRSPLFCIPYGVTGEQLTDVVKKYLGEHPEQRHATGASLVITAMANAFPCRK